MGKLDQALQDFGKALELNPGDAQSHHQLVAASHRQLANALLWPQDLKLRDGVRALEHAKTAVKLDPTHYENFLVLGQVCRAAGELQSALIHFDRAAELAASPVATDRVSYYANQTRSDYYKSEGQYEEALAAQTKVLPLCSNSAEAGNEHYDRGVIYLAMQDYDKALADFSKSIELAPEQYHFYKRRATTHFHMGSYDDALADLDKALELNPEDLSTLTWIPPSQVAACPDQQFKEGIFSLADKTIELTNLPAAYTARARLRAAFGQHEESMADLEKAMELAPRDAGLCNEMAWFLATLPGYETRDANRAVESAKKAIELEPKKAMYWNTLGVAQYRDGQWQAAVEALNKSIELGSDGISFDCFFLAMAHWQLGNKEEARRWYDKAVEWMSENMPDNEELLRFRAEAVELLGIAEVPPDKPKAEEKKNDQTTTEDRATPKPEAADLQSFFKKSRKDAIAFVANSRTEL
jgi:tetratricopeptide (TPR) repeat protein